MGRGNSSETVSFCEADGRRWTVASSRGISIRNRVVDKIKWEAVISARPNWLNGSPIGVHSWGGMPSREPGRAAARAMPAAVRDNTTVLHYTHLRSDRALLLHADYNSQLATDVSSNWLVIMAVRTSHASASLIISLLVSCYYRHYFISHLGTTDVRLKEDEARHLQLAKL